MKQISIVFAMVALGCGPKGGATPTATSGPDCEQAITNGLELSKAAMPDVDDKMRAKMHDLGVKNCQDDKWSADAVKCMVDAKSQADAQGCYGKLTPDQQAKMNKSAQDLAPSGGSGAGGA